MSKKLPFVKSDIPRDLRMFLDRVRELVSGSGDDRLISADELASGVLTGSLVAPTQSFMAAPPAPVDVTATAAVRSIFVEWDAPAYAGHAYAEVWSASTNSLAAAVLLGMAPGGIYVDDTGPGATRYYWVRFVNTNDVKGPYNATSGVTATTMPELEYTMDVLAKEYGDTSEAPFFQLPNPLVIDGVTIAAGTYMKAAYIYNGVITNAKIANLAVDDAKIANLSVGKLTAGSIAADQYIQSSNYVADTSGFRLDANGNAYLQNAVVRGTVFATAGTFAGSLSAATGSFAGSLSAATGTFAGSLSAATGTFSGSLTATAINAVNTVNIAGNAVTVPSVVTLPAGRAGDSFLGGAANVFQSIGTFYPSEIPSTTKILVSAYLNDAYMQFNYDPSLGLSYLRAKIVRLQYDATPTLLTTYTFDSRGEITITSNGETIATIDFGPGKHIVPNQTTLDHHTRVFSVVDSITKPTVGPWVYYLNICRPAVAPAASCYIAYGNANSFCLAVKR